MRTKSGLPPYMGEVLLTAGTKIRPDTNTTTFAHAIGAVYYIHATTIKLQTTTWLYGNLLLGYANASILPFDATTNKLGSTVLYWLEVHAATGGFIEHSPRKFSKPCIDLIKDITKDSDGNIVMPKEFGRGGGTSIGDVAYATAEALKEVMQRLEKLEEKL